MSVPPAPGQIPNYAISARTNTCGLSTWLRDNNGMKGNTDHKGLIILGGLLIHILARDRWDGGDTKDSTNANNFGMENVFTEVICAHNFVIHDNVVTLTSVSQVVIYRTARRGNAFLEHCKTVNVVPILYSPRWDYSSWTYSYNNIIFLCINANGFFPYHNIFYCMVYARIYHSA